MSGCMDVWMSGCLDFWMSGCLDVLMSGCLDVWMSGCLDVWMYGCWGVWVSGGLEVRMCAKSFVFQWFLVLPDPEPAFWSVRGLECEDLLIKTLVFWGPEELRGTSGKHGPSMTYLILGCRRGPLKHMLKHMLLKKLSLLRYRGSDTPWTRGPANSVFSIKY